MGTYQPVKQQKYDEGSQNDSSRHAERRRWPRTTMLFTVAAAIMLVVLSSGAALPTATRRKHHAKDSLRFKSDGTFQIAVFEDLHFGENAWDQWGSQQDLWSVTVIREILAVEDPQLAVLNGDLITGENTYLENSTEYIDQIVAPLVERGMKWASTYGNHDSNYNLSREGILAREHLYRNALTTQMVFGANSGVTNYYLPIYPSDGSKEPALILWFFDSRGGVYYQQLDDSGNQVQQPNWIDQSVVDWFVQTSDELRYKYGRDIPSLAFVHIPTQASQVVQTEMGIDRHYQPGINKDYPLAQQAQGWCEDGSHGCKYGGQDQSFIDAIATTPGLIGLFSGHVHGNTWCYRWEGRSSTTHAGANGLNLCFGQHSGYGGYGTWTRGSRQILVTEGMLENLEIETWIRLENAEIVGAVTLNASYNNDWYPATADTHTHCPTCLYVRSD